MLFAPGEVIISGLVGSPSGLISGSMRDDVGTDVPVDLDFAELEGGHTTDAPPPATTVQTRPVGLRTAMGVPRSTFTFEPVAIGCSRSGLIDGEERQRQLMINAQLTKLNTNLGPDIYAFCDRSNPGFTCAPSLLKFTGWGDQPQLQGDYQPEQHTTEQPPPDSHPFNFPNYDDYQHDYHTAPAGPSSEAANYPDQSSLQGLQQHQDDDYPAILGGYQSRHRLHQHLNQDELAAAAITNSIHYPLPSVHPAALAGTSSSIQNPNTFPIQPQ
ncbi:uncharacterized protein F5891DRAFT_988612 [Suillus fuscotomentosus]|uniref:Uncharacterized protein n=1 Tax=Suillus fuscotomentosus TaxID=1912939 RepID=A0AAD4DP07_9AGAM|nr:uncharacterized protein F5891DRAFT_988612 [Suillus fuscotomentosus]KAG1886909.1 hypothetical protein F5891DRAFT_988612 [Suillus fuscotomentosus]